MKLTHLLSLSPCMVSPAQQESHLAPHRSRKWSIHYMYAKELL